MDSFRVLKIDRTGPVSGDAKYNYPRLRLQGRWLENVGFEAGDLVQVSAEKNRVLVEKILPERN